MFLKIKSTILVSFFAAIRIACKIQILYHNMHKNTLSVFRKRPFYDKIEVIIISLNRLSGSQKDARYE